MSNAKNLLEKLEERNLLFVMIEESISEIITEFNKETNGIKYSIKDAGHELINKNYPPGTFCIKINLENFIFTINEVLEKLYKGYQKSAVKSAIYDLMINKIK